MWAALPRRWRPQLQVCRRFAAGARDGPPITASETTFGLLQSIQGVEAEGDATPTGRVLSASGGLARVALSGPVSIGASVDLGEGSKGVVIQFDRKGSIVAPFSHKLPKANALAVMGGQVLVKAPARATGASSVTFASVTELLDNQEDSMSASELLRLPPMPNPARRRLVKDRMPSGLAAVEALLPLGVGQRIGLVGPAGTGKSRAVRMLLASQPEDTVCVYAAQRPLHLLEKELQEVGERPLTVVHADPVHDSLASRYLAPICAIHLAAQLRKSHRHVLLVLDDLVYFASAAAEMQLGGGGLASRGLLPLSVPQILGSALDGGGTVADQDGQERSLSVVALLDLDPNDELPSSIRELWRSVEPSLDVSVQFSAKVAQSGILPAIDPKEILPCGFAPTFQAPFLQLLRSELSTALREGYDLSFRMELAKQLNLQMEDDEHEALASSSNARALLSHATPRELPELAVLLAAALVYRFPGRRPTPLSMAQFQKALVECVRDNHPALWSTLGSLETLSKDESQGVLQNLGEALMEHRFDFRLTRPEL